MLHRTACGYKKLGFDVLVSFSEHSSCEAKYLEDKKVVKMD